MIDDELQIVRSVQNLLRLQFRVHTATNADEAMEILKKEKVHVVMSDQRMPGMTGVEFLNRVHAEYPDAIRLLFTGYADVGAVIDAINKGNVYRYITKPWDPDELQLTIRDACARYDLNAERKQLLEELREKNAALSQSNELKSAFIKVAGHEFRTPVTILVALAKLGLRDPNLAQTARDHLQRIDNAAGRLERLMNQILTLLSAEKFELMFDSKPAVVETVLKTAAEDVKPFLELRQQKLILDFGENLGTISADAEKIRDSLNDLLLNAVKFTPDGGRIELRGRRTPEGVIVEVVDSGSGIAPQSLPRIFEPFFTGFDVSRHSSGRYEHGGRGLGLGLSIVKTFAEMHGGSVAVESELGKGSTFRIFLPDAGPPVTFPTPAGEDAA